MADLLDKDNLEAENAENAENAEAEVSLTAKGEAVPEKEEEKEKRNVFGEIFDSFETFCHALVLMMILFVFVFRFVTVNGTSMVNTLHHEDKLIISDMFYTPSTGDIVVLNTDGVGNFSDKYIIKRIIATGGQTVEIDFANWVVAVDGVKLDEKYVNYDQGRAMETALWINTSSDVERTYGDNNAVIKAKFTVPDNMFFAMGDNRNGSSDSRSAGCFEEERILGRVLIRIGPMSDFGRVE